jgi:hypothetical protein
VKKLKIKEEQLKTSKDGEPSRCAKVYMDTFLIQVQVAGQRLGLAVVNKAPVLSFTNAEQLPVSQPSLDICIV